MVLPVAYLRVLTADAEHMGLSRSMLVQLLLKRRLGEIGLQRVAAYPPLDDITQEQLETMDVYRWHTTPAIGEQFEKALRSEGLRDPGWFLVMMLNNWLNLPDGFAGLLRERARNQTS